MYRIKIVPARIGGFDWFVEEYGINWGIRSTEVYWHSVSIGHRKSKAKAIKAAKRICMQYVKRAMKQAIKDKATREFDAFAIANTVYIEC